MLLCLIALIVFSFMSLFSAKYRPLAKEAWKCAFNAVLLRPCDARASQMLKVEVVSSLSKHSKTAARFVNKHFQLFAFVFVALTVLSFTYSAVSLYNFYFYGNCDGPKAEGACILNDITGDYGRFRAPGELKAPSSLKGLAYGDPNASLIVVEFGCFTCPYTKQAEVYVKELLKKEDVYYVFKPFPLPNHENSFLTARAVLCAAEQGKEWALRDAVFANQESCGAGDAEEVLAFYAESAGLNMTLYNQCMQRNETGEEVASYFREGLQSGVYATPTFFINGKPYVGPKAFEEWYNERFS